MRQKYVLALLFHHVLPAGSVLLAGPVMVRASAAPITPTPALGFLGTNWRSHRFVWFVGLLMTIFVSTSLTQWVGVGLDLLVERCGPQDMKRAWVTFRDPPKPRETVKIPEANVDSEGYVLDQVSAA